ncbi:MAG: CPBP family intramembrane metalloprotease [Deltaproteobacteria bacterium]|nr:CPBP family intramembrane metalloprotease [Deltaproteobacteria bacterium]
MSLAPLCGVCGAPARAAARFCARCGAERDVMIARDAGAGPVRAPTLRSSSRPAIARGLAIALGTYALIAVAALVMARSNPLINREAADVVSAIAGAVGLAGLVALRGGPGLGLGVWRWRGGAIAILAAAALAAGVVALGRCVPILLVDPWTPLRVWGASPIGGLVAVALAALAEELAFRGAVLGGLRAAMTDRAAIGAAAIMFALFRAPGAALPLFALLGGLLGTLRVRTGSLWPGALVHVGGAIALARFGA